MLKPKLACSPSSSVRGPTQTYIRIRSEPNGCTPGLCLFWPLCPCISHNTLTLCIIIRLKFLNHIYCICVPPCAMAHAQVRGQLVGVDSFLPPCKFKEFSHPIFLKQRILSLNLKHINEARLAGQWAFLDHFIYLFLFFLEIMITSFSPSFPPSNPSHVSFSLSTVWSIFVPVCIPKL